jgi:hypothetical protein
VLEADVQAMVRDHLGLRIEPEMSKYILGKSTAVSEPLAVIGADARTGVPRREIIDPRVLYKEQR